MVGTVAEDESRNFLTVPAIFRKISFKRVSEFFKKIGCPSSEQALIFELRGISPRSEVSYSFETEFPPPLP